VIYHYLPDLLYSGFSAVNISFGCVNKTRILVVFWGNIRKNDGKIF